MPVTAAGVVIGKDPTCDAPIDDPFVSARHARIVQLAGRWILQDLESTNGTFISGARIGRATGMCSRWKRTPLRERLRVSGHSSLASLLPRTTRIKMAGYSQY